MRHGCWGELTASGPVILDGAWGTQLQTRGLEPGECPDVWNLTHPDRVREVAQAYVDAGSEVILTNTFRANRITLSAEGLAEKTAVINCAGARISRSAAGSKVLVFGSIGPTGQLLMMGESSEQSIEDAFFEQAQALAEGGVDAVVVETISDIAEARLAISAVHRAGLPVVVSLVFDSGKNHDRTMMGAAPEQVARELTAAGADAVGANCGLGIAGYVPICERMRSATSLPLWIKANAGLPQLKEGRTVYQTAPEEFASMVPALVQAGAGFIGGCCGTTPEFIRAVKTILER